MILILDIMNKKGHFCYGCNEFFHDSNHERKVLLLEREEEIGRGDLI